MVSQFVKNYIINAQKSDHQCNFTSLVDVSLEVGKVQYVEKIKFVKFYVHNLKDKPRGKPTLSGFLREYG